MAAHKHTDVTPEEYATMQLHHRKTEYNAAEMMQVYNLVRKYVNPHQGTCTSCNNVLREAKNSLNSFYLQFKDEIEARHTQEAEEAAKQVEMEKISEVEKAKAQVKDYADAKCKCRNKKNCKCKK